MPRRTPGRGRARCVALIGGGCLAPVAAHHDGTTLTRLVAAEDGSWIERRSGRRSRTRSRPSSPARCGEDRRHAAGSARRTWPSGSQALGHEVVRCPLIRDRARSATSRSTSRRYDWVVVTSANGARELLRRGCRPRCRVVAAIGPATAEALGGARPRAGRGDAGGAARRAARPPAASCSPAPRARARCSPTSSARTVVPSLPHASSSSRRRCRPAISSSLASASAARAPRGARRRPSRPSRSGPQTARAARAAGVAHRRRGVAALERGSRRGRRRPRRTTCRRLGRSDVRHLPHRLRPRRTTSSARATA